MVELRMTKAFIFLGYPLCKHLKVSFLFAIYMFIFLLSELLLNDLTATRIGADKVLNIYASYSFITVIGYVLFAFVQTQIKTIKINTVLSFIGIIAIILYALSIVSCSSSGDSRLGVMAAVFNIGILIVGGIFYLIGVVIQNQHNTTENTRHMADVMDSKRESVHLPGAEKKCPDCAEMVKKEARKCRFCGYMFKV